MVSFSDGVNAEFSSIGTKPSLDQFLELLRSSPMLETLGIRHEPSEPGEVTSVAPGIPRIPLLALKSLSLRDFSSPHSLNTVLGFLKAPNLTFLDLLDLYSDLYIDDPDFSGTFQYLVDTAESFDRYRHLQSMRLGDIDCDFSSGAVARFLEKLGDLRKLHLVAGDPQGAVFARCVLNLLESVQPVLCPRLEILKTSGIVGSSVLKVASRRANAGAPLKTLFYTEGNEPLIEPWRRDLEKLGMQVETCDDEPLHVTV